MASPQTIERNGRADWTLMTAIHHALRRDLGELITTTVRRWIRAGDGLPENEEASS